MSKNISQQFKFLGFTALDCSIIYGIFLVTWGLVITQMSNSNSVTSLIPTFLGLPILILSFLSKLLPSNQKLFMHVVVLFGFLSAVGGGDFFRSVLSGDAFGNFWADISKLTMLISGCIYCFICIQHFRYIKIMKNAV